MHNYNIITHARIAHRLESVDISDIVLQSAGADQHQNLTKASKLYKTHIWHITLDITVNMC